MTITPDVWKRGALLTTCEGTRFEDRREAAIIRVLADTGIRRGELAGLRLGDLEIDAKAGGGVSPSLQHRRARVVDITPIPRFVEVTESVLVEFSAVDNPGLSDTTLMVGNPGSRWVPASTVERFGQLRWEDSLRLSFPASVEVFHRVGVRQHR